MKNNIIKIIKKEWKYSAGIIFLLLIAFNVWAVFAYIPSRDKKNYFSPKNYELLNPTRAFLDQNDLIINIQPLRSYLENIGKNKNISVYFESLSTGANISINKEAEFWPASLLKLPVAMAVTKKIERGEWRWNNELVIMSGDKDDRFGDLYKQPVGTKITIEELVKRALVDSDNTANFILVRNLETKEIEDIYTHLGLSEFISKEGKISAKKYSVMLRSLYNAAYLSEENSQKLLSWLTATSFDEYLGGGLPKDANFAHKIGVSDEKNVFLDSGIVYPAKRPYLLTVMINTADENFAKKTMKEISEKVYNYIKNYKQEF